MSDTCRPTEAGYLVNGEHYDDCEDQAACAGCWPCVPRTDHGDPLSHCTARGRCTQHVPEDVLTCPRCLAKTRDTLVDIERMAADLVPEAIDKGVDSEAANLAGPAADPWAMQYRALSAMAGRIPPLEDDDSRHPLTVLGWWDEALREDYDQHTLTRLTVARAVEYLNGQLDRFAQDEEQDFPLFVREITACRSRLEAVLHDQRGPETGAPCHLCPEPQPALRLKRDDRDTSGASDRWTCPTTQAHAWSDAEYRLRVGDDYLAHADRLTASQLERKYRIKPGTLRQWVARKQVAQRGRDDSGRILYDVAQALAMRDKASIAV